MAATDPLVPDEPLFSSAEWFRLLEQHCFAGQQSERLVGAADGASCTLRIVRTGPLTYSSLSNWYSFRWMPEIAGPAEAHAAALRAAVDRLRHRAAHAVFSPVPTADGTAERLIAALRESGWRVSSKIQSHNSWAEIPAGRFAEWWAARPGQLRSTVARKGKKGAVAIRIATRFDPADWQAYSDVYAASWKQAEGHPEFLRALAQAAGARGALRLGLASIDGAVVAAQFWTIEAGIASIHKLAQLRGPQIDACSPGTLLTHALYRHAAEQDGVTRIDFGTGNDSFKQGWTDAGTALMTIETFDLSQPRAWPMLARLGARRLAGRVLRR